MMRISVWASRIIGVYRSNRQQSVGFAAPCRKPANKLIDLCGVLRPLERNDLGTNQVKRRHRNDDPQQHSLQKRPPSDAL